MSNNLARDLAQESERDNAATARMEHNGVPADQEVIQHLAIGMLESDQRGR